MTARYIQVCGPSSPFPCGQLLPEGLASALLSHHSLTCLTQLRTAAQWMMILIHSSESPTDHNKAMRPR